MTSVLANQLQALARQRQPALPVTLKKGKASLLYDFQKAADVDLHTIYDISCQGLDELIRTEPRFRPYRESLFSRASLEINPDLQTADFLSKLDESITGFCCLLSSHFLSPAAFKVLEYLVRRYKANERNVAALMTAALPYHATNEFVRLVQILALGQPGSLWGWLAKMQTSGAALPRALLVQRAAADRPLLLFVCSAARALGSARNPLRPPSRTFLSFYAVFVCEVLAALAPGRGVKGATGLSEDLVAALLPFLLEGLGKSAAADYRAATLMVVAELASRAALGREFVKVLFNTMLKHADPDAADHTRTSLLVMAHVAVTQSHINKLSDKTLKYLSVLPNAISELCALAQRGTMRLGPLLLLLARSLAATLASNGGASGAGARAATDLVALAHGGALAGEPARAAAAALLEAAGAAAQADQELRPACQKVLRVLDQRYPQETDAAVNAYLSPFRSRAAAAAEPGAKRPKPDKKDDGSDSDAGDEAAAVAAVAGLTDEERSRFDFVRATFTAGGYSAPCGDTMLTLAAALAAPQAAVRRLALTQLDADVAAASASEGADSTDGSDAARSALLAAALGRLADDDLGVVVAALGLSCLRTLPPAALLAALQPLLYRLADALYGSARPPQLKAARKAIRKAVELLRDVGSQEGAGAARDAAAAALAGLLLPSRRDPRVAVEAAVALSELGVPLFAGLAAARAQLEDCLKPAAEAAVAAIAASSKADKKGRKAKTATAEEPAEKDASHKPDKKAEKRNVTAAVERAMVAALADSLAAEPAPRMADIGLLMEASVAASAAAAGSDSSSAASTAAVRTQHILLLAAHAASISASGAAATALRTAVVQLSEILLPYARVSADQDWPAAASDQLEPSTGLPTPVHSAAVQSDLVSSHAVLILAALSAGLRALPEATTASPSSDDASAAVRRLRLLSFLDCPVERLHHLPFLATTRAARPQLPCGLLSDVYAAPQAAEGDDSGPSPALQAMALHVQAEMAAHVASAAGPAAAVRRAHHADVGDWLVALLPPLSSRHASVRAAACACLEAVAALGEDAGAASVATGGLSGAAAAAVASALVSQRKLLRRDADAAHLLLLNSLVSAGVPAIAAAPTPAKRRGAKAAASGAPEMSAAAVGPGMRLDLSSAVVSEVCGYLTSRLEHLPTDLSGVSMAASVLACMLLSDGPASPASALSPALFAPGCNFLARLLAHLHGCSRTSKEHPSHATPLHAAVATQLLRLFTPASAAAASADNLGLLAAAADLIPSRPVAPDDGSSAGPSAALALIRLAAISTITPELFGALSPASLSAAELFAALLGRYEGDADEAVRSAARTALETIPLSAELVAPLLDPTSAAPVPTATITPASTPAKKSKKADGGSVDTLAVALTPAAPATDSPPSTEALRDAVMALELLQWRTGIARPAVLVSACQALLRRLLPIVGSIATTLPSEASPAEGQDEDTAVDAAGSGKSSLAGYAATLALQALTALTHDEGEELAGLMDLGLAVRTAREAPDAAVRNAALGLLAALASKRPESALSHVLEVLSVVHTAAALADDDYSRRVAATALGAVVPAWVAAGRGCRALWEAVAGALPGLPPHRRLELLLVLLRALPQAEEGLSEALLVLLRHASEPQSEQPKLPATPLAVVSAADPAPKSAKKARQDAAAVKAVQPAAAEAAAPTGPQPSEWLPGLASALALQVELAPRLDACARVLDLTLAESRHQPHQALPRVAVAFVTAQLKLKAALSAATASHRRPEPDPQLEAACRRLMEAALAQMQLLQPDAIAADHGSSASPSAASRLRRAVLASSRALYGLFGGLQGVMAPDAYLQALLTLVEHPADRVKRRAIKLLTDKVRRVRDEVEDAVELPQRVRDAKLRQAAEAATRACGLLPKLLLPTPETDDAQPSASPLTRQLALVALAAIAGQFGTQQPTELLGSVPALLTAVRDAHASVRASALAAVASVVKALGPKLVPVLPATVAAAVAAADSAWNRLARAGGAAASADADMEDAAAADGTAPAKAADSESDDESDGDEDADTGKAAARRRPGSGGEQDEAALELSSALACLNALVETLGGFLSPHLPAVLAILLNPRVLACTAYGCDAFAASIRSRLPATVPPRLLLPALYDRLQPCIAAAGDVAAPAPEAAAAPASALLAMVAAAVSGMEPKAAAQYHEQVFAFLLRALDVRQRRPAVLAPHGEAAVDVIEAAVVRALVALCMKLSEARFKPMFLRLTEWAASVSVPEAGGEPGYLGRMVALFGAVNALADRLRSVLVPYYRYLMDTALQHLGEEADGGKPRGKKKAKTAGAVETAAAASVEAGDEAGSRQVALSWLLRLRIVRALHRCFMHDSVGFVDAERFGRLQPVLTAQLAAEPPAQAMPLLLSPAHVRDPDLDATLSLGAATRAFTAPDGARSAGPLGAASLGCLLALAVAAGSDALWRPLNHGSLLLTRSPSARVRALGLELVAALVGRLREEYLVLLPEALPFLGEALEDGEASLAERVRQLVTLCEEISGESLDEYLRV